MQGFRWHRRDAQGFTLIEVMMGAAVLAVVLVALTGSLAGQAYMKQHARNLTLAMSDATRVMEEIRKMNSGATGSCANGVPSIAPPNRLPSGQFTSWNEWLAAPVSQNGGGGKTVETSDATRYELLAVTCQGDLDKDGVFETYCGTTGATPQIGANEWTTSGTGTATQLNPIRVTVSIGWLQQGRVVGGTSQGNEFAIEGAKEVTAKGVTTITPDHLIISPTAPDVNNNGVIDSQAMLTTFVTCR